MQPWSPFLTLRPGATPMPARPTGHRQGTPHQRRRPLRSAAVTVLALLSVAGCGGGGGAGSDGPTAPGNHPPTLASLSVTSSSTTYLRADLAARASDPDRNLSHVVIAWGDSTTTDFTSGLDTLAATHDYATGGSYTVTATAYDDAGNQVTRDTSFQFAAPPSACRVVDALTYTLAICEKVQSNYDGTDVTATQGHTADTVSVKTSHGSYDFLIALTHLDPGIPWQGPPWTLVLTARGTFSKTKGNSSLIVTVFDCNEFFICNTGPGVVKAFSW